MTVVIQHRTELWRAGNVSKLRQIKNLLVTELECNTYFIVLSKFTVKYVILLSH
jgi:hypothetical protein